MNQSLLTLYEQDAGGTKIALGMAHSAHLDIRTLGLGRFSHWKSSTGILSLYFSTSDNNDAFDGRTYYLVFPAPLLPQTP